LDFRILQGHLAAIPMVGFQTAEDLEKRGLDAFVDEDFDGAVNFYTEALSLEADNASVYINRAAAHVKLENYTGTNELGLSGVLVVRHRYVFV